MSSLRTMAWHDCRRAHGQAEATLDYVDASRRLCRERESATYLIAKGGDRRPKEA